MEKTVESATSPNGASLLMMGDQRERLQSEHRELKARLSELNSRICLSPAEQIERKKLKKLKLLTKDRLVMLGACR